MRTSRDEKEKTARRIVHAAARLLRERGIEAASITDVMNAAGLTHGGFYRHFEGKDALILAALDAAFAERLAEIEASFETRNPADAVAEYRSAYLDERHIQATGIGCPMPALGGEVAHAPAPLKSAFGANVRRVIQALARGMGGAAEANEARAAREIAMLAGAILLARASDPETRKFMLAACRAAPGDSK